MEKVKEKMENKVREQVSKRQIIRLKKKKRKSIIIKIIKIRMQWVVKC